MLPISSKFSVVYGTSERASTHEEAKKIACYNVVLSLFKQGCFTKNLKVRSGTLESIYGVEFGEDLHEEPMQDLNSELLY